MLSNKQYKVIKDGAKPIGWDLYYEKVIAEFESLLENSEDKEEIFQKFFEENPAFVPGALELYGQSGHYPYMDALISQPDIGTVFKRKPDFIWLANDSLTFVPVLVEIERPNKKMFNKDGTTTAAFNQAIGQIYEWKYLLNQPMNIQMFYDYFDLQLDIREKTFKPQYLLIYGRREEYQGNKILTGVRAAQKTNEIDIMSFDRLKPISDYRQFVSCKVSNNKYKVINIAPSFRYRADCAEELIKMSGFYEKISDMKYTSEERKEFLRNRYNYWCEFGKKTFKGIIRSQEGE